MEYPCSLLTEIPSINMKLTITIDIAIVKLADAIRLAMCIAS